MFDFNIDNIGENNRIDPILFPDIKEIDGLYYLDWDRFDNHIKEKHIEWIFNHHINNELLQESGLSKENIIKFLEEKEYFFEYDFDWSIYPFDIDKRGYKRGILHYINLTKSEWNNRWGYDTCIREDCLSVAIKSSDVVFKLICDSDDYTNEYNRMVHHLSLYKFWGGQTGRGLLSKRTFPDGEDFLNNNNIDQIQKDNVLDFKEKVESHKEIYNKYVTQLLHDKNGFVSDINYSLREERINEILND